MAVAAVRDPRPAHRPAVARQRGEGGGGHGRHPTAVLFLPHCSAAPGSRDHGRGLDPDDLSAHRLRRDIRHHRRRAGDQDDEPCLPDLCAGAAAIRRRRCVGRRHRRGRARQYRRLLPRAAGRQEPGDMTMARRVSPVRIAVTTVVAWTVGFVIFFPILWTVLTSFKTELEAFSSPPKFLFFKWTLENYRLVQERSDYLAHAWNSVALSSCSVLLAMLIAVPGIASTLLLNVVLAWNEAFWTLNLTTSKAAPLTAFIASYSSPEGLFWAKLSAASTLAIAPILVLGWLTQRQLVRGLTFGAVK